MPSMAVHFAVGIEFLKYNKIKDKKIFREGILKPDILGLLGKEEKEKAHYTDPRTPDMTLKKNFSLKVNLLRYLTENEIKNDFDVGYYLHLLTDYYFFTHFMFKPSHKAIRKPNVELQELYNDYEKIAREMEEVYGVDNRNTPWYGIYKQGEPIFFTRREIHNFIKKCAHIDIFCLRIEILKNPQKWRSVAKDFFK